MQYLGMAIAAMLNRPVVVHATKTGRVRVQDAQGSVDIDWKRVVDVHRVIERAFERAQSLSGQHVDPVRQKLVDVLGEEVADKIYPIQTKKIICPFEIEVARPVHWVTIKKMEPELQAEIDQVLNA